MIPNEIDTVVVGGGQSGIAISEHLRLHRIEHIIFEKSRIVESWRTQRWDSLVANGPAWHDCFPSMNFTDIFPDKFASKNKIISYFEDYSKLIDAPIHSGTPVTKVLKCNDKIGYRFKVYTKDNIVYSKNVIVATGPFQIPEVPLFLKTLDCDIFNIHSSDYYSPSKLPEGAVLVVGGGSSGSQIADELQRSGRKVFLSIGKSERPPRSYRGRDFVWWLGVLGLWDEIKPIADHVTIAVSGARGGFTIDYREMANRGIVVLGKVKSISSRIIKINNDLNENLIYGDNKYLEFLEAADSYIIENKLELPVDQLLRLKPPDSPCISHPVLELDINKQNIKTIIWATGYRSDYSWLECDVFDRYGNVLQKRGITSVAGLYFVGLPWLSNRSSSFIWGTWYDAKYIVDNIIIKNKYLQYDKKCIFFRLSG